MKRISRTPRKISAVRKSVQEKKPKPEVPQEESTQKVRKSEKKLEDTLNGMDERYRERCEKINARYNELIKELWTTDHEVAQLNLSPEAIDLLNRRCNLWIEYFLVNSAHDPELSLFDFFANFVKSMEFIHK